MAPHSASATSPADDAPAPNSPNRNTRGGDRNRFRHRDPVDAVHEIGQIDEPKARQRFRAQRSTAMGTAGSTRIRAGRSHHHRAHRHRLRASRGSTGRLRMSSAAPMAAKSRIAAASGRRSICAVPNGSDMPATPPSTSSTARNDRDTAALRRRNGMRGPGVRPRQGVAPQQRPQRHDQGGADERGGDDDRQF